LIGSAGLSWHAPKNSSNSGLGSGCRSVTVSLSHLFDSSCDEIGVCGTPLALVLARLHSGLACRCGVSIGGAAACPGRARPRATIGEAGTDGATRRSGACSVKKKRPSSWERAAHAPSYSLASALCVARSVAGCSSPFKPRPPPSANLLVGVVSAGSMRDSICSRAPISAALPWSSSGLSLC